MANIGRYIYYMHKVQSIGSRKLCKNNEIIKNKIARKLLNENGEIDFIT